MTTIVRTLLATILCAAFAFQAQAELRIDITRGTVEPLPIAVTDFVGGTTVEQEYGRGISRVIAADLERSGLFKPLDSRAFIQNSQGPGTLPRFGDWRLSTPRRWFRVAPRSFPMAA